MEQKGFTLIETIITLCIIALLSTILVINMVSLNEKNNAKQYTEFKETITTAGCSYIDSDKQMTLRDLCKQETYCNVTLSTLITDGLIDSELIDPSNNKTAKEEQDNIKVNINWKMNDGYLEKECTFSTIE